MRLWIAINALGQGHTPHAPWAPRMPMADPANGGEASAPADAGAGPDGLTGPGHDPGQTAADLAPA
ncbi:MAG: hypothetical protein LBI66_03895 [Burkholderiaceae bacterium]|nr:hypothetical protein [Burkholderiaceae bacterium]